MPSSYASGSSQGKPFVAEGAQETLETETAWISRSIVIVAEIGEPAVKNHSNQPFCPALAETVTVTVGWPRQEGWG